MNVTVIVDVIETDTQRGYHDRSGTVVFQYPGNPMGEKWERAVVQSLIGQGWNMWETVAPQPTDESPHRYTVHYGYDSGD